MRNIHGHGPSRFETLDRVQPYSGRVTERLAAGNAQLRPGVGIGRTLPHRHTRKGDRTSEPTPTATDRLWSEGATYGGASGGYEMGARDHSTE